MPMRSILTYTTIFRTLVLCIGILLCTGHLSAQYNTNQNKNWVFGGGSGLSFTSGSPVPFASAFNALEGGASVSDVSGNLLFYTNGNQVWNKTHALMPSGASIVSFQTNSTTQSATIVPYITDPNKYYIFSLQQDSSVIPPGYLAYSIVDMSLNGGLGDVIASSKGTIIDSGVTEKMVVVPGNNCNMWVIVHDFYTATFYAFEVTASGISPKPVVSSVGSFGGRAIGVMKVSHDRKKIAAVYYSGLSGAEILDFDPATGKLSNSIALMTTMDAYGAEFSPDNTKLYLKSHSFGILQFDVSLSTSSAIIASQKTIYNSGGTGDIKLGPNGMMYLGTTDPSGQVPNFIDRINYPNSSGTACAYISKIIDLTPNSHRTSLPSTYWSEGVYNTSTATVCQGDTVRLMFSGSGTTSGIWSSNNTPVATVSSGLVTGITGGTAVITYTARCGVTTTTVTVRPLPSPGTITGKTSLCIGDNVSLSNAVTGGSWVSSNTGVATINSSGSLSAVATGTSTISYTVTSSGCSSTTTKTAAVAPLPNAGTMTGALSHMCISTSIKFSDATAGGVWSSSNTNVATVVGGIVTGMSTGTSTISYTVSNACNTAAVTKTVTTDPSPGTISGALSICGNITATLSNSFPGGVWSSSNTNIARIGSTGIVSGVTPGTTTISYSLSGCPSLAVFTVNIPPENIAGPSFICSGLSDKLTNTIGGGTWESSDTLSAKINVNTGDITALAAGTVIITYTLSNGCQATDTITILPLPDAGVIAGATSICPGTSTILTSNVPGGVWSSSNTTSVTISGGLATGIALGTSTISYTVTNACGPAVAVTLLTVGAPPDAGFIFGPDLVCKNAVFNLSDTITNGIWSSSNNTVVVIGSASGTVSALQKGTTIITYAITTTIGCKGTAIFTVTVLAAPPYKITGDVTMVQCYNNSDGNITAGVTGGIGNYQYTWSNGLTTPMLINIPTGTYTLHVKETSSQCNDSVTFVITQPNPLSVVADITNDLCKTSTGSIKLSVTGGSTPYSYHWSANNTSNELTAIPADTYTVTVTDINKCTISASATVSDSCDQVVIADVITPNGDGINDAWLIDGLQNYPNNLVQVFGKWGDLLYSKSNYHSDFKGAGNNGGPLPDGTYIYLLKLDGANTSDENKVFKGTIMIKH
ncbi:MAG: surface protein [Flavipsychrobacter sp.]|nr:surface protein [Flavipsychrobacter sp.]